MAEPQKIATEYREVVMGLEEVEAGLAGAEDHCREIEGGSGYAKSLRYMLTDLRVLMRQMRESAASADASAAGSLRR